MPNEVTEGPGGDLYWTTHAARAAYERAFCLSARTELVGAIRFARTVARTADWRIKLLWYPLDGVAMLARQLAEGRLGYLGDDGSDGRRRGYLIAFVCPAYSLPPEYAGLLDAYLGTQGYRINSCDRWSTK